MEQLNVVINETAEHVGQKGKQGPLQWWPDGEQTKTTLSTSRGSDKVEKLREVIENLTAFISSSFAHPSNSYELYISQGLTASMVIVKILGY